MSIFFEAVKCYAKGNDVFKVLTVQLEYLNISGQLRYDFYLKPLVALNSLCHFTKMPHFTLTFAYCLLTHF